MCRTLYQIFHIGHVDPKDGRQVISRLAVPIDAVLLDDPGRTVEHIDFMLRKYYPGYKGSRKEER